MPSRKIKYLTCVQSTRLIRVAYKYLLDKNDAYLFRFCLIICTTIKSKHVSSATATATTIITARTSTEILLKTENKQRNTRIAAS